LAIDDPGNRVALVAALRSPVLGCSDEELFLWTVNGGSWTYLGGAVDGEGGPERVRDALRLLRELHRARAGLSLPELVRRVLDDTGAVEHALTQPEGRETAANLLKLVDQARDFSASGGGGLRAFTRWLARNRDEESEETDAGVSEETDDVVRLITIHGAKGLEFPIVGLANLHSRGSNQFRPIPDAEGHRLHVRLGVGTKGGYFTTPGLDDAKDREKKFSAAERLRLLYVGVTRARDHLVVPWVGKAEGMLGALADSLPSPDDDAEMATELEVHVVDRATLTLGPDAPDERGRDPRVPKKELSAALDRAAVWETERVDLLTAAGVELPVVAATSLEKPWRPVVASAEAPDASLILGEGSPLALGDAVHRVMQLVTFPGAEDLEEVVAAICSEGELDEFQDEVLRLTQRCLESPAVVAAQSADQIIRELPFTVQGPHGEGYVTGRIDLLYRVEDDWTVLDYKTDTVEDSALAAAASAHEAQVSAYVEATRLLAGVAPRVVLIYPRVGGEVVFTQVEATGDLAQAIRPG
ncbi:MAG TPA: 3'-5' exonuclease, partial [Baekduia sp.]|nr:3'-5' exonuclease [Baekduia sp.]